MWLAGEITAGRGEVQAVEIAMPLQACGKEVLGTVVVRRRCASPVRAQPLGALGMK